MTRAPISPTTSELHALHPLSDEQLIGVELTRMNVNDVLNDPASGLFAIVGACALVDDLPLLNREAAALRELEATTRGLVTVEREASWKPRSESESWHGMESTETEVDQGHRIVTELAGTYGNVAMEFGYIDHADRYARSVAFAWLGARNAADMELLQAVANHRAIPLGIKNGEDGDIDAALQRVETINRIRGELGGAAVLLYRGGKNALNPRDWEAQYPRALELTNGRLIVDTAHGGMRGHTEGNGKSLDGQRRAAYHVLKLAEQGYAPAGIMMEASGTKSVVDPNLPHNEALVIIKALANIKASMYALAS